MPKMNRLSSLKAFRGLDISWAMVPKGARTRIPGSRIWSKVFLCVVRERPIDIISDQGTQIQERLFRHTARFEAVKVRVGIGIRRF